MTTAMQLRDDDSMGMAMSMKQLAGRVNLVHNALNTAMKKGTHYGTVPNCGDKMVLLKPGADMLAMMFRLVPQFQVERTDLGGGHREYDVTCSMYSADGQLLGQGVGSACTKEKKYRYRQGQENPDIADVYNTVLKIAKKRAHIDATLTVTGAADLFTQDLIDEDDGGTQRREPIKRTTEATSKPAKQQPAQDGGGEEGLVESGQVELVTEKSGNTRGKEWTRYGIKVGGEFHNTFHDSVAETAREAHAAEREVRLVYELNSNGYRDIVSIDTIE